jgi:CHAT domain-containing protein
VILPRQHATLAAVVEHLPDTTHFHVSSHGRYDPVHAARSGVQLVGGVLRLEMLQDITLLAALVVVLSACETGLADIVRLPEEFIGLPTDPFRPEPPPSLPAYGRCGTKPRST